VSIADFKGRHTGETMLLVGNGKNLKLTPPEMFNHYPSIGMNTIVEYRGWKPTYYTAVDRRVEREFGKKVRRTYADVQKFVPTSMGINFSDITFHRWDHAPGPLWKPGGGSLWQEDIGSTDIIYANIMHVAIKLAYYMGPKNILIIGMEHDPANMKRHFWTEIDPGMGNAPRDVWLEGYRQLAEGLQANGVRILNISENTFVPEEIIPRDDWKNWTPQKEAGRAFIQSRVD
jgi:hypothetical protein